FVVLYLLRFDCFYCSFSVHAFADISPLSLHDALPISWAGFQRFCVAPHSFEPADPCTISMATKRVRSDSAMPSFHALPAGAIARSEEHTSELQSRENLVCRLLLEKKKKRVTQHVIELF